MSKRKRIVESANHTIVLGITVAIVIFPFFWMVATSLTPPEETLTTNIFPSRLYFDNYRVIWQSMPLMRYLRNSTFVGLCTTIISLLISLPAGYSMSRYRTKVARGGMMLFIFSQLIPGVLPFIAFYFIMFNLNLTNTFAGLIIAYSVWSIPFCVLMMNGYFTTAIPSSLEEGASIDGCSKFGVFFRIALPLSVPGIASVAIFSFILAWNEFMWASVILTNNDLKPVSVGIFDFVGQHGNTASVGLMMASAVIVTIPTLILFGFLQKFLISGLTAGAVKG